MPAVISMDRFKRLPDPVIPEKPQGMATIVSVFPKEAFNSVVGSVRFEMPACKPCDDHKRAPCERCNNYAKLTVGAAIESVADVFGTDGSMRRLNWIPARQVAESLTVDNCNDRGIFVAEGSEPTIEELKAAQAAYRTWAERMVSQADELWGQKRDAAWINPHAREAAKFLAAKREWLSETETMTDCEACGERNRKGSVLCRSCKHPVQWQKAFEMGLLNPHQEAYGRKSGQIGDPPTDDENDIVIEEIVPELGTNVPETGTVKRGPGRPRKNPVA